MFDEETPINDTNLPLSIPEAVWDHQHKIHHPSGVCTSRTRVVKGIRLATFVMLLSTFKTFPHNLLLEFSITLNKLGFQRPVFQFLFHQDKLGTSKPQPAVCKTSR